MQKKILLAVAVVVVIVIVVVAVAGLMWAGYLPSPFGANLSPTFEPLPSDQYALSPTPTPSVFPSDQYATSTPAP